MKVLLIVLISILMQPNKTIYDFPMRDIDGQPVDLSTFKGKKILIVNTASKCGFTPQYKDLERLAREYSDKLVVIGFPANNFGGQEPGSNSDIQAFCEKNYGVSFLLSQKISVDGPDIDPLFAYLISTDNPDFSGPINWNFEKFLIDEEGQLIHRFRSKVSPLSQEIVQFL